MGASIKDVHTPGGGGFAKSVQEGGRRFRIVYVHIFEDATVKKSILFLFWNRNVPTFNEKKCANITKK